MELTNRPLKFNLKHLIKMKKPSEESLKMKFHPNKNRQGTIRTQVKTTWKKMKKQGKERAKRIID